MKESKKDLEEGSKKTPKLIPVDEAPKVSGKPEEIEGEKLAEEQTRVEEASEDVAVVEEEGGRLEIEREERAEFMDIEENLKDEGIEAK